MDPSEWLQEPNRVLVTDDDPDELFATSRILRKAGYRVEEAGSGKEALEKAERFMPDLLLLDVVMPEIDGFEICQQIKSNPRMAGTFVVLLSSIKKTPEHQAKGLDAGADGFIARPFDSREFVSRIQAMMRIKAVEKELRLQRQWLRVTMSSIGDGLIATDDKGRILFMNPVAETLTGWRMEEAKTKKIETVFRVIDETTGTPVKGPVGRVLKEGMIVQLDDNVLLIRKDQQRLPIADSAAPIQKNDGKVIGAVLVFRDVTEKKLAHKRMVQSMNNWEAMFNSIAQMSLVIDPHYGIQEANDVALRITGLKKTEIVGRKCFEILCEKNKPPRSCPMVRALRSGHQESSFLEIEKLDGDFLVSCTPVLDVQGNIQKIIHIATDISDLKRTEKDLRKINQKYRTLFKSSSDAVFLMDSETSKIIDANETAARLYGYTYDELIARKATDLSAEPYEMKGLTNAEFPNATPVRYHRKKDGTLFPVEITVNEFQLEGRKVSFSAVRDISQRVAHERDKEILASQLRQSQKMESIGNLAGGIAHDFNNILFPIIGLAELLLEDLPPHSQEYENAQRILNAGERGAGLIKQILAFSRQSEHKLMPVRPQQVLTEVLKLIRATIPSYIDIEENIQSDCGLVMADATQIHQVAMNILTNAFHAVESKRGKIAVQLKEVALEADEFNDSSLAAGRYVLLSVADTGHGIPPDLMKKIFEPYFTTKEQDKGTGLGLAVAYGIIKEHKGHIKVYSEAGKGTTFNIYLPLMEKTTGIETADRRKSCPEGNERILLVDDDESVVHLEKQMLERLGYRVTERTSSTDALKVFRANPSSFDLVISDMAMPIMTGDQLARELKSIRPEIPIILCTGFSEGINNENASTLGIKGLLMKPIVKSELAQMVRKALA